VTLALPSDAGAGVYVHFPFCAARCTYCDFASVAGSDERIEPYLDALEREIALFQPEAPRIVDTVYLGGGTPSRMSAPLVLRILDAVRGRFDVAEGAEITLEGNPESLVPRRLEGYATAGVNRVCVGIQSLDDRVLRRVGRLHDGRRAMEAVKSARAAGFRSVGLDLIAGLPGEDLRSWAGTVRDAAALGADHVSVYLLETDKDTPLARSLSASRVEIADDDALARAYEESSDVLEAAGFAAYEISNFARPGHESRHNLKYWTDVPYAGFGLGAHGYLGGERRANVRDLDAYVGRLDAGRDPVEAREAYDPGRRAAEALILGLRLAAGVDLATIGARYGTDPATRHHEVWERAESAGLVEREGSRVRLTRWGRLRCNELFLELI
jgi:oxygen-independent coproporphyrinogen III oxidase